MFGGTGRVYLAIYLFAASADISFLSHYNSLTIKYGAKCFLLSVLQYNRLPSSQLRFRENVRTGAVPAIALDDALCVINASKRLASHS